MLSEWGWDGDWRAQDGGAPPSIFRQKTFCLKLFNTALYMPKLWSKKLFNDTEWRGMERSASLSPKNIVFKNKILATKFFNWLNAHLTNIGLIKKDMDEQL